MAKLDAKRSLLVVVLASFGASICCVGPLILLMLGIGGAWIGNLTALEPYRPLFIGVTFIFLAVAFRKLYLVPQNCEQDSACASPRVQKQQRFMFWVVAGSVLALLAVPLVAPMFFK